MRIVASRAGAAELDEWAAGELHGFRADAPVPAYRGPFLAPARGTWMNMVRYVENATLTDFGVPQTFRDAWFMVTMRQPVAELESLTMGDGEPQLPWDPTAVAMYDGYAQAGRVSHPTGHHLVSARTLIPRGHIVGLLDTVRTRVLELALDLEGISGEVGERGGPTVADLEVAAAAQTFYISVYGDGANIATGAHATLRSKVRKGDEDSLRAAAAALGLATDDVEEFIESLKEDGSATGPRATRFIERVRMGAVALGGNIVAGVAADQLVALAQGFLGG